MLLVIDVGNTNIVLGIFDGEKLVDNWRIWTERDRTSDEYGILVRNLFSSRSIWVSFRSFMRCIDGYTSGVPWNRAPGRKQRSKGLRIHARLKCSRLPYAAPAGELPRPDGQGLIGSTR